MNLAIKPTFLRGINLFVAVLLVATVAPQILSTKTAFAGDGYLWDDAATVNQSTYDWGYQTTCPTSDPNCMLLTGTLGGHTYGEADPWVFNLRNCTSYVAYKINQVFGINIPSSWGDAKDWDSHATGPGHPYTNDSSPQIGDIAQWTTGGSGHGHVAYVFNVVGGVAYYDEYNYAGTGSFTNTYTSATEGAPTNWIHIGTVSSTENPTPGAVSWGSGRIDAFYWGTDGKLSQAYYDTSGDGLWHLAEPLNQTIYSGPAASSWGSGRLDVFFKGSAGDLLHQWYDSANGGWHAVESLGQSSGGQMTGEPSAVSWGSGRIDVFVKATDNKLYTLVYNASAGGWQPWSPALFTTQISSSPGVSSWGVGRLDVFTRDSNNHLLQGWYTSSSWNGLSSLSATATIAEKPGAVSWGSGRIDVFSEGTDGKLWQTYYDQSGDSQWHWVEPLNQSVFSGPTVSSWGSGRLDVFFRGSAGDLLHQWYDSSNGGWHAVESLSPSGYLK